MTWRFYSDVNEGEFVDWLEANGVAFDRPTLYHITVEHPDDWVIELASNYGADAT